MWIYAHPLFLTITRNVIYIIVTLESSESEASYRNRFPSAMWVNRKWHSEREWHSNRIVTDMINHIVSPTRAVGGKPLTRNVPINSATPGHIRKYDSNKLLNYWYTMITRLLLIIQRLLQFFKIKKYIFKRLCISIFLIKRFKKMLL